MSDRDTYVHEKCEAIMVLNPESAEQFNRDLPEYGDVYCIRCGHVCPIAEFAWEDGTALR